MRRYALDTRTIEDPAVLNHLTTTQLIELAG